ncbi:MAG: hypothetical protein MJZ77_02570 [Bacteroidales bacterium]|nr:hypothetical protein [Bacteroidales bacterium]
MPLHTNNQPHPFIAYGDSLSQIIDCRQPFSISPAPKPDISPTPRHTIPTQPKPSPAFAVAPR